LAALLAAGASQSTRVTYATAYGRIALWFAIAAPARSGCNARPAGRVADLRRWRHPLDTIPSDREYLAMTLSAVLMPAVEGGFVLLIRRLDPPHKERPLMKPLLTLRKLPSFI
jgi:hypothetical protein